MLDFSGQQIGNYRLIRLLGEGGFARVYLGEHIYLGTRAAIKLLQTARISGDDEHFLVEARTIAHLVHPHIVRVLDFGIESETPFLVMDYAMGGTLRTLHPKGACLPLKVVSSYVHQIASALHYAHQQKIIHRDVKPENMLLGAQGEVMLSDFGIALIAQTSAYQSTQDVTGTISYMAPEHIQGKPRFASDQYALGVVAYEWLCGSRPFHGSFTELCAQHLHAQPPLLRERMPELPASVEQVVFTALAKDPKERFSAVQEFALAFEQACYSATSGRSKNEVSQSPGEKPTIEQPIASRTTVPSRRSKLPPTVKAYNRRQITEPYSVGYPPAQLAPELPGDALKQGVLSKQGHSRRKVLIGLSSLAASGVVGFLAKEYLQSFHQVGTYSFSTSGTLRAVAWSPDSKQIAAAGRDSIVQIWNIGSWGAFVTLPTAPVISYRGHAAGQYFDTVNCIAWSTDGKRIVSTADRSVQVWDASKGDKALTTYQNSDSANFSSATWSPDGRFIASTEYEVRIWHSSNGQEIFVYKGHINYVNYAAWSPDGKRVASVANNGTVHIWDAFSGKHPLYFALPPGQSGYEVVWSPDGKYIAVACSDGIVRVWNTVAGRNPISIYKGPLYDHVYDDGTNAPNIRPAIQSVAWSLPDGKRLAAAGNGKVVQIWQVNDTKSAVYTGGNSSYVEQVAWSPDGKYVASCGDDGEVHVWYIPSAK